MSDGMHAPTAKRTGTVDAVMAAEAAAEGVAGAETTPSNAARPALEEAEQAAAAGRADDRGEYGDDGSTEDEDDGGILLSPEQADNCNAFLAGLVRTIDEQLEQSPASAESPVWREQEEEAEEYLRGVPMVHVPTRGPMGTPRMTPVALRPNMDAAAHEPAAGAGDSGDREMTEPEKVTASNWLFACSLLQTFGMQISQQATNQIWLDHFAGDFSAHARMMTRLSSTSSIIGFVVKPWLASMTDKFGRKRLLALSPLLQGMFKCAMTVCPRHLLVPLLTGQYIASSFTVMIPPHRLSLRQFSGLVD